MMAFKVGDKVVPISKRGSKKFHSAALNRAKGKGQDFIYINSIEDYIFVCSDIETTERDGDYFEVIDLKLYKPTKNQRIATLEKEVAHMKEYFETLRGDYLKDIELLQERFEKKINALEKVLADKSKLRQSDEQTQQDVQRRTVTCGHQVPPYKTPNEQRAELIEDAKVFIELAGADNIEFAVNEKYRAVTAIWYKGIEVATATVKCEPDKVFNVDIFKAVALGRVLGRNVTEFENAVQPTEVVVGMSVESQDKDGEKFHYPNVTKIENGKIYGIDSRRGWECYVYIDSVTRLGEWAAYRITDDTNAIYTEEAQ